MSYLRGSILLKNKSEKWAINSVCLLGRVTVRKEGEIVQGLVSFASFFFKRRIALFYSIKLLILQVQMGAFSNTYPLALGDFPFKSGKPGKSDKSTTSSQRVELQTRFFLKAMDEGLRHRIANGDISNGIFFVMICI